MSRHILEKLAATNPDCEIWWDSSPLVYDSWRRAVLKDAPAAKRTEWTAQLDRLFDPATADLGFHGVTTNPPLTLQAIQDDPEAWTAEIRHIIAENPGADVEEIYWLTYLECLRRGAEAVLPLWERSGGRFGLLSGQVDPRFVTDYDRMQAQAFEIARIAPNIMVKLPGSAQGYRIIEELTAAGVPTNNTTSFTVPQYIACMDAVSAGLDKARAGGVDLTRWRSVITHMSARLGNLGDLKWQAEDRGIALSPEEITIAELEVMKRARDILKERGHPSKMLMCSMRVARDDAAGTASSWHIEKLAGGDFVYTCPPSYIHALMEVEDRLPPFDPAAAAQRASPDLMDRLRQLPYFRKAYDDDGMTPDEFVNFGAFIATAGEFAAATRKTIDFVARVHADAHKRAA